MVIPRILGGLGNQLFVYAAARRLSIVNNVPIKLDVLSAYEKDPFKRKFSLHHFNIQKNYASAYESYAGKFGRIRRGMKRLANELKPLKNKDYLVEKSLFDEEIFNFKVKNKIYIDGYFQTERYFLDVASTIRQEFQIVTPHDDRNNQLAEAIKSTNSVCMHARRMYDLPGDAASASLSKVHALSEAYYSKAIAYVSERVSQPHFYCFGDHPEWFAARIKIDYPITVVKQNKGDDKNYEDLWLMSLCKHFIISNSTFAWWGAWLGGIGDKIVLAPNMAGWPQRMKIPEQWITIDS
jgi:hypothetical protein